MRRILQFIMEHRRAAALAAALFLSVSMMLMGESAKTRFARMVTTAIFNTGRFTLSWGIHMMDLWKENRRLRLENLELSYRVNMNIIAEKENQRLRKMLELKNRNLFNLIAAQVVGRDTDQVVNTLIIDAGSRDGVRKNMACASADGLVGRIHEVYPTTSSIQIIADVNSRVSAMVVEHEAYGIVSWDGGRYLRIYGLPLINEVKAGDKVYTSGLGDVFPAGILIGSITKAPLNEVEIYASYLVKPAVDFSKVHELFVIQGSERPEIWDDGYGSGFFKRSKQLQ